MQLLPRNGHGLARFQLFDSATDFLVPSLFDRLIRNLKTVKQSVG